MSNIASRSRHPTGAVAAAALAVLAGCASTSVPSSSTASSLPTGPVAGDQALSPFYAWSGALPARPGVMLRTEPAAPQAEITAAALAQRMLYTSRDLRWNAGIVPVTGTLYLPQGTPPAGGWPIVAWGHGTLGMADRCAPSWAGHRPRDAAYLNRWLAQGFAVVATDYQGLGGPGPHPYLIWEAEGRSILDAVRAALAAHPQQLANSVVITGQSQGSGASLGASRIAPRYAPELTLRATIATGLVSTFPDGPYKFQDPVPSREGPTRFNMLRLLGGSIPAGAPSAESLLTEGGQMMLLKAREVCIDELRGIEQKAGLTMGRAFKAEPAQVEAALSPVTDMTLSRWPAPVFLGTGLADRTIVPQRQFAVVKAICAAGNAVQWRAYAGITHNGIVNAAFDDELTFVRRVLAGQPTGNDCASVVEPGQPQPRQEGMLYND